MAAPAPPRAAAGRHACRHLAATTTEPGRPSRARPTQPPHRCPASLASPVALAGPAPQPHQPPRPCSASQRLPATSGWPSALASPPSSLRAPKITSKKSKRGTVLTSTDLLQQQHRSTQRGRRDAGGRQRTDCVPPDRRNAAWSVVVLPPPPPAAEPTSQPSRPAIHQPRRQPCHQLWW